MKTFWKKANFKGHLLTAISYMIPIVCGAGFIIAIGMAFGGTSQDALVMGANWWVGLLAIAANVVVTGTVYALIKKDIPAEAMTAVRNSAEDEEDLDLDAIQVM